MLFNCKICKEIKKYDIQLTSFNIINKLSNDKQDVCLNVAVSTEFLKPIKQDDFILEIPFSVKVVAVNNYNKEDEEEVKVKFERVNINSKELAFAIDVVHVVSIYLKNDINDDQLQEFLSKEIKSDIKNILRPYIDETLNYASFKIGIPRLEVPL